MDAQREWRQRARLALQKYFQERSFPRALLTALLVLTGLIGFGISWTLLRLHVLEMSLRYPLAVLGSYACFLGLIRIWVELERLRFDQRHIAAGFDEAAEPAPAPPARPASRKARGGGDAGSWLDFLDATDFLPEFGEGCLVAFVFALVAAAGAGLVVLLMAAIFDAPALLAEVFLDAFLIAALYGRLRTAAREHWLGTALRQTWWTALMVALLLALAGWCLEWLVPGAHTLLPALRGLLGQG